MKSVWRASLILVGLVPSTLPLSAQEDAHASIGARGRELLDGILGDALPGASAALVLPDGETLAFAVGRRSADEEGELEPADRMLSGSIGKTYVAAAALQLAQEGALDLDALAASYFEDQEAAWLEHVPNAREVTLRQLLRHQSGIPRYVLTPSFSAELGSDPDRTWTPEELLVHVHDHEPLFAPGQGWAYADTNYIVVGMVIEQLREESFYDYVRAHLLAPHGLRDTLPSDRRELPGVIQGHVFMGRMLGLPARAQEDGRFVFNPQFEWCGGGWANTPLDLARWARLLYSGRAFDGPYLEQMTDAVAAPALGPGVRYGIGVMVRETPAGRFLGHDGTMPGYLGSMGWFPELEMAAAIQVNSDDARAPGRPLWSLLVELVTIAEEELAE